MRLSRHMADISPSDIRKWTAIIDERHGVNLAQGMCFIEPLATQNEMFAQALAAMEKGTGRPGYNTYTDASGVKSLRQAIARKAKAFNGIDADPASVEGNIVVTNGATGALSCALDALLDPGDEVLVFEPYYNYHVKGLQMKLLIPVAIPTHAPGWSFDREDLERALTPRTRAVIITNPCNPTGRVFEREELQTLVDFAVAHDLAILADEVYEFITFDGRKHISIATLPGAEDRTVTISAFSKTLAITGWRIGYTIAPKDITTRIKTANEMTYVCAPSPLQHAVAHVSQDWRAFLGLGALFQAKRDLLLEGLRAAGLPSLAPQGATYVLTDVSSLGRRDSVAANIELVERYGIAGVPGSAFFKEGRGDQMIRFCFAHTDAALRKASAALKAGMAATTA